MCVDLRGRSVYNGSHMCEDVGLSDLRDQILRFWSADGGRKMTRTRVADLTVDELKDLIREVVAQTILDTVEDPDQVLELREEAELSLRDSLAHIEAGGATKPAGQVAADLELEW